MTHQSFENRRRLALHHARGMQVPYQRVLFLRNEGKSDIEIAEHEGVSDSTIKNRSHKFFPIVVAMALVVPATAGALTSYHGSDFAFDYEGETAIQVCDQEVDGNTAYAKYVVNGSGSTLRLDDPDEDGFACGQSWGWTNGIYSHQVCEDINNQPDSCGTTVYP